MPITAWTAALSLPMVFEISTVDCRLSTVDRGNSAAMHRILGLDRRCRLSRFQPLPHLVVWHNARLLKHDPPIAKDHKVGNSPKRLATSGWRSVSTFNTT